MAPISRMTSRMAGSVPSYFGLHETCPKDIAQRRVSAKGSESPSRRPESPFARFTSIMHLKDINSRSPGSVGFRGVRVLEAFREYHGVKRNPLGTPCFSFLRPESDLGFSGSQTFLHISRQPQIIETVGSKWCWIPGSELEVSKVVSEVSECAQNGSKGVSKQLILVKTRAVPGVISQ